MIKIGKYQFTYLQIGATLLFLLACYFPLFLQLDTLSLRLWDEARRGVNALEMIENGNWLIPHFDGKPDMWGTKPPLLVWLQAIFMKLLGVNELAIRLPSALAGLATAILLVVYSYREFKKPLMGIFAALILLTSDIYIESHGARAGDYDTLLALWLTAYLLSFLSYLKSDKSKYLYLTGFFVLLAGLTKGIAGFFFLPGLFLFMLFFGKTKQILTSRHTYLAALIPIIGVLSYYFLREIYNPGFLETVWHNELGGRYFEAKDGHSYPFYHYFRMIYKYKLYFPWMYFLPLGFFFAFKDEKLKSLAWLLLINTIIFFLVLSTSQSKLTWYFMPVLPSVSLMAGLAIESIYTGAKNISPLISKGQKTLLLSFIIIAFFTAPYITIIKKVYQWEHGGHQWQPTVYRNFMRQNTDINAYTILTPSYNGQAVFYKKAFNRKGQEIDFKFIQKVPPEVIETPQNPLEYETGSHVMVCEQKAKIEMDKAYNVELVKEYKTCKMLKVISRKGE